MKKNLRDITAHLKYNTIIGDRNIAIEGLSINSKQVKKNTCFIAIRGTSIDGHIFIHKAIDMGANTIVCEQLPKDIKEEITYIEVQDSRLATAVLAKNYYNNPSSHFKLIGITGTNGKSTVATLTYQLLSSLNKKCALLSTIENRIIDKVFPTTHTTLDAIALNEMFCKIQQTGCEYVIMECSSHAIHQKRIYGLNFDIGVFTNITQDHLDYHNTFSEYLKVKQSFISNLPKDAYAIINADDRNSLVITQNSKAKKYTYSLRGYGDINAHIVHSDMYGLVLEIDNKEVHCLLRGNFNAYNLLAVYTIAEKLGLEKQEILTALSLLESPEGRFQIEVSPKKKIIGIIDYAHTPDALKNLLESIFEIKDEQQKIIVVFGCGGDRDVSKRPLMTSIGVAKSDIAILTSDNPRTEKPEKILEDMLQGLAPSLKRKTIVELDRKKAIQLAVSKAENQDIVIVCGKGHEKYQEIGKQRTPFNDREIIQKLFVNL